MPLEESIEDESSIAGSSYEELVIAEDQDYIIEENTKLPFQHEELLGKGHSAVVAKVHDRVTGKVFAQKTITFRFLKERAQKEEHFNNEVKITRRLKGHHHIVRLYATYIAKREFCLILQPAADEGNLEEYLGRYWEALESKGNVSDMEPVVEQAFGCLASGLAYMHGKRIRHKDIKPRNILMHKGLVVFTDFGSSKDASQPGDTTTEGPVDFLTRKYSPPEVIDSTKRNFGADIWSLGCVFVELLCVLTQAFEYDEKALFSHILDNLHAQLSHASKTVSSRWSFLPAIITSMTLRDRAQRPSAASVFDDLSDQAGFACPDCNVKPRLKRTYSSWEWSSVDGRYYCYIFDEQGKSIGHVWSDAAAPPSAPSVPSYPAIGSSNVRSGADRANHPTSEALGSENLLSPLQPPTQRVVSGDDSEALDSKYRRVTTSSHVDFFVTGRVFKMLWTENAHQSGSSKSRASSYLSVESDGEGVFAEIRRFIVVHNKGLYSQCIPIQPYRRRRSQPKLSNLLIEDHGVIYTSTVPPDLLPGENIVTKTAIRVWPVGDETLKPDARVNYGKQYAVEHNVKIVEMGMVAEEHRHLVLAYFEAAMDR